MPPNRDECSIYPNVGPSGKGEQAGQHENESLQEVFDPCSGNTGVAVICRCVVGWQSLERSDGDLENTLIIDRMIGRRRAGWEPQEPGET